MSYDNENTARSAKTTLHVNQSIAATEVRLRDFIDPKTAKILVADFDGEGGHLWQDNFDNLQLKRIWLQHQPTFGMDEPVLNKFEALSCKGKKSIVAHNGEGGGLIMLLRDALAVFAGKKAVTWHRVRLPEFFDVETGKLIERNAVGSGYDLWQDDIGNIQVRTRATTTTDENFFANVGTEMMARICELPCTGARSLVLGAHKDVEWIFPVTGSGNLAIDFRVSLPRKMRLN